MWHNPSSNGNTHLLTLCVFQSFHLRCSFRGNFIILHTFPESVMDACSISSCSVLRYVEFWAYTSLIQQQEVCALCQQLSNAVGLMPLIHSLLLSSHGYILYSKAIIHQQEVYSKDGKVHLFIHLNQPLWNLENDLAIGKWLGSCWTFMCQTWCEMHHFQCVVMSSTDLIVVN